VFANNPVIECGGLPIFFAQIMRSSAYTENMKMWMIAIAFAGLLPFAIGQEPLGEVQKQIAQKRHLFSLGLATVEDVKQAEERYQVAQAHEFLATLREGHKQGRTPQARIDKAVVDVAAHLARIAHDRADRELSRADFLFSKGFMTMDEAGRISIKAAGAKAALRRAESDQAKHEVSVVKAKFEAGKVPEADLTKAKENAAKADETARKEEAAAKLTRLGVLTGMVDRARKAHAIGLITEQQLTDIVMELVEAQKG
jgi:hypothetical protein